MEFELKTNAVKVRCYGEICFVCQQVPRTNHQTLTQVSAGNELLLFYVLKPNNEGPGCEAGELVVAGL